MRWLILVMSMTTGAVAAECDTGNADILKVQEWDAADKGDRVVEINYTYMNTTAKQIDMVDAALWFTDALGKRVGVGAIVDPDPKVKAGDIAAADWKGWGLQRLPSIEKKNVTATICVRAVLYEDGTKETFE